MAAAAVDISWPLAGPALGGIQTLTPRIQFVGSPGTSNLSIPNEDSRAVDLEDSNLFALNRFPGYDRWEDGSRVTWGAEWSLNVRSEEHTSELQSLMRISYAVFRLKKKKKH